MKVRGKIYFIFFVQFVVASVAIGMIISLSIFVNTKTEIVLIQSLTAVVAAMIVLIIGYVLATRLGNSIEKLSKDLEKFRLAVENTSNHIVITDAEGTILYANPAVEAVTGFTISEVIGKKVGSKELWGGQMEKEFYKKLWQTVKIEKRHFEAEIKNKRKSGEIYIAETKIDPIINADGEVVFFVAVERDITKAKEVDRMKTEFISLASHQLRTPLSAMKWFLEMLLGGDAGALNPEQKGFAEKINQSNERMIELVNGLLNVSRIESGRIIVEPVLIDIKELINEVLVELESKLQTKKQTVVLNVESNLPQINLDPKLTRSVYLSLLTNAIKYSRHGSEIQLIITKNENELISRITDKGYGVPESEQKKMFDKFFRGTNIVQQETDGTGLGLYLAKMIVQSWEGRIWFESQENKGTTFWFTLPLSGVKPKKGVVTIDS